MHLWGEEEGTKRSEKGPFPQGLPHGAQFLPTRRRGGRWREREKAAERKKSYEIFSDAGPWAADGQGAAACDRGSGSMTEAVVAALITGGLSLAGVILSNDKARQAMDAKLDKQQAVTETKIEELTREVRAHNDFARRVPVMEEQIKVVNHRLGELERIVVR